MTAGIVFSANFVTLAIGTLTVMCGMATTVWVALINRGKVEQIHQEIKSPNGTKTGDAIHEIKIELGEMREDIAAIAVEQGRHEADPHAHEG